MRKVFLALGAAVLFTSSWVAEAAPYDQPEARAYLSYAFGGHHSYEAPLRYGLRMDLSQPLYRTNSDGNFTRYDSGSGFDGDVFGRTAAMKLEGDLIGNATASLAGVPFAGRVVKLNEDDTTAATTPGGFTWFDWSLLGVGVGGLTYIVIKATKGKSDH